MANKPKIRFKGFDDAWEQRKLGDLVGIYDGVHQTPEYQDSGIMFLSVENIATLKSEKYISKEAFERDYKVYPEKGDILMTRIGDVGTTNVVETAKKVAFYVSLALLKPNGINSYFLSNAMKTNAFQKGLRERTLVTAIPQKINKDEIGKIDIFITNNDVEQQKIGAYFSTLDHLITLHQRKCDQMKELKKYMLTKMFPQNGAKVPEIRFDGFIDDWEQRKLSDVVDSVDTGKSKFDKEGSSGEYPILGSTSVIGYDDEYDYEGDFILSARVGANAGSLYRHAGKVKISDNTVFIQASQNIEFLYQLLIRFDIKRLSFGTGQPLVKASELKRLELMMPTDMEEQIRIGVYFKNLDHLITLHQSKCENLKNLKEYMLRNMFV